MRERFLDVYGTRAYRRQLSSRSAPSCWTSTARGSPRARASPSRWPWWSTTCCRCRSSCTSPSRPEAGPDAHGVRAGQPTVVHADRLDPRRCAAGSRPGPDGPGHARRPGDAAADIAAREHPLARFFREWTGTVQVDLGRQGPTAFPSFDAAYAQSMNDSFDRFVLDQVRDQGTLRTLLRSTDASSIPRWPRSSGCRLRPPGQWAKVTLDASRYSGVVTQPAMLASLAHSRETSFVFRGRFVRKQLLCENLGFRRRMRRPTSAHCRCRRIPPARTSPRRWSRGPIARGATR